MATTTYVTVASGASGVVLCVPWHKVEVRVRVRVRVRVWVGVTLHLASCGQAGRALVLGPHQGNAVRELIEAGPGTPRGAASAPDFLKDAHLLSDRRVASLWSGK